MPDTCSHNCGRILERDATWRYPGCGCEVCPTCYDDMAGVTQCPDRALVSPQPKREPLPMADICWRCGRTACTCEIAYNH